MNEIPRTADALVESVYEFNRVAGSVPPGHFDAERVGFYIGMQLEELAEQIRAVLDGCVAYTPLLKRLHEDMVYAATTFKEGAFRGAVLRADRAELLDGAIDSTVVSLGAAIYQTPRFREAIAHVLGKNADKAPNGVATRDANGKVMKPAGWTKPDLTPFVDSYGIDDDRD